MERKGLGVLHGVIAAILAVLALLFGGNILIPLFGERGAFLGGVLIALIALIITVLTRTKLSEVFPVALPPVRQFFGSSMMFIGVSMFGSAISVLTGRVFNSAARSDVIDGILLSMSPILAIVLVAVLPAVCEEFFCRGFLVRCFDKIKNEKVLIAIIGALFGILHLDLYTFIPTALIGAVLCFIAIRTKSLIVPMILHFANNAFAVALTFITASEQTSSADIFSLSIFQGLGMSVLYIGLSILPFFAGLRMFEGKKVFHFKTFVALLVSIGCVTVGSAVFTLHSFAFHGFKADVAIVDEEKKELPLNISGEGEYHVIVFIEADDDVTMTIVNGDKILFTKKIDGSATVYEIFDIYADGCKICFESEDGDEVAVIYTYVILESVLPQ